MRGRTHRWCLREDCDSSSLSSLHLEPLVARVLASRGLIDAGSAQDFWDPKLSSLHAPSLLPGTDHSASRLLDALGRGEPIVVYGDYDVDGICASAILYHTCKAISSDARVSTYIPHRIDEGYGLHVDAMRELASAGARVVVSVDCGATAVAAAAAAREAGLDLIITDHHNLLPDGELPAAFGIVHPRICPEGSVPYPFHELCGAGVAFKLAWRMLTLAAGSDRVGDAWRKHLLDMLALSSLGTIADVVPLVSENRIITRFGLARLPSSKILGIQALLAASRLQSSKIDTEEVGFVLAPKLNAAGRMGHAAEALELLITEDVDRAREIADSLVKQNEQRRATERRIFEQACELAEQSGMTGDSRRAIILAHPEWHPGVVGIVCSRLIGRFHRPTILMQDRDGECHGSGRSVDGFNLHAALVACAQHLDRYGGHDMAAGVALQSEKLLGFAGAFLAHANERVTDELLVPALHVDCAATVEELTPLAVRQLGRLGPFGRDNPRPRILVRGVRLARKPETFGAHAKHVSLFLRAKAREMRVIAWKRAELVSEVRSGQTLDVVVVPKLNEWNGRTSVEPELGDLRILDPHESPALVG